MKKIILFVLLCFSTFIETIINPMNTYTAQALITQTKIQAQAASLPTYNPPTSFSTSSPQAITVTINQDIPGTTCFNNELNNAGIIIQTYGSYQLNTSLKYQDNKPVFTISSSNVKINLQNNTIFSPNRSVYTSQFCAIFIEPGVSNVTIENGTICGFPGAGIIVGSPEGLPCNHITLKNIKIINCFHGIFFYKTTTSFLKKCLISDCFNQSDKTIGVFFSNCSSIECHEVTCLNNKNPTGYCYGFYLFRSSLLLLEKCKAINNQGLHTAAGFYLNEIEDTTTLNNCTSQANESIEQNAYGFLCRNSNKLSLFQLSALQNKTKHNFYFSYGISFLNSHESTIKNSFCQNNDYGFYDDEPSGMDTNLFIQNKALGNIKADYLKPFSCPLPFSKINQHFLQGTLQTSPLDNISIIH